MGCKEIIYTIFDIYGSNYYLNFNKKNKHNTIFGLILGIISILSFCILSIYYIIIIIKRKKYSIKSDSHISSNIKLNITNFPLFISYFGFDGENYINNNKLNSIFLSYVKDYNQIEIPLIDCNLIDLKKNEDYNFINNYYNISNSKCLNYSDEILINNDEINNKNNHLNILLYKCNSLFDNKNECYNESELYKKLDNSYFIFGFIEYYIDYNSINNPIKKRIKIEEIIISYNLKKTIKYYFEKVELNSNNGYFFNSITSFNFYTFDSYTFDFYFLSDYNPILLTVQFYSNNILNLINRNYLKFQDAISNLESYINFTYKFICMIYFYFSQQIIYGDIINNLILKDENKFYNQINNKNFKLKKLKSCDISYININKKNKNYMNSSFFKLIKPLNSIDIIKNSNNLSFKDKNKKINQFNKNNTTYINKIKSFDFFNLINKKSKLINFNIIQYFLPLNLFKTNKKIILYHKLKDELLKIISIENLYNLSLNFESININK